MSIQYEKRYKNVVSRFINRPLRGDEILTLKNLFIWAVFKTASVARGVTYLVTCYSALALGTMHLKEPHLSLGIAHPLRVMMIAMMLYFVAMFLQWVMKAKGY